MLPEGWSKELLKDIVVFLDGKRKPIKSEDRSKISGPYPYYGATGIIDWVNDFIFDDHLILMGEDGENILSRSLPHVFQIKGKTWVNNHAHVLKPKDFVDIGYLTAYLESLRYEKYNSGSAQPKLNKAVCEKIPVSLPPLPEQKKIAQILSTWDSAISATERLLENSQQRKKALMQQLLTGKKRLPGFVGEWTIKPLGEITKIYDGTHQTPNYVDTGIPFYSVEHLTSGNFDNTKYIAETVYEKENQRVALEKNDILMTRIGDIGTAKKINWDVKASFYVSLALIKFNPSFDPTYLENYINSSIFQTELWKRTIHVAFPKKINLGEIGYCEVILPSLIEQKKIAEILTTADQEIDALHKRLDYLKLEKKALMQQLLTGKRRVQVDAAA